ncbi:MAG: 2,3-bisphosphoglycerate-independent phosphoglycerate mutase [Deltaproteobacteria bacterium]|nr:2,3-bisphosphoglycerate-independent phosphoglycerate mutase [Deltaproteobacteria bacterium]
MTTNLIDKLIIGNSTKIVFLIMDGLGGLPIKADGPTELEAAQTPYLDELAAASVCGLLDPIGYGITPGSGPAHFALFGYDPIENNCGRGLLTAAGVNFPMTDKDLFIRANFATMDAGGLIIDRRAGRIDTETNRRICLKLRGNVKLSENIEVFFETEREHRALIALRGDGLNENIEETDPQATGKPLVQARALVPEAQKAARAIAELTEKVKAALADEPKANTILLRGYAKHRTYPSLTERFGLKAMGIANYPMYRGIAKLLGMTVAEETNSIEEEFAVLEKTYQNCDFFFVHIKPTDSRGEDGNFDAKVEAIEMIDRMIPIITDLNPDVLVVTGDHSTPAALAAHSWHPVPVLLSAKTCRPDRVKSFGERDCLFGGLGRMPTAALMGVALAHAGRLAKFGA